MRWIMLSLSLLISVFQFKQETKVMLIENEMYELYSNGFKDYLTIRDNYMLSIDTEKMTSYLLSKGYSVIVEVVDGEILVKFQYKFFKEREKVYSFYMAVNNEYK